MWFIFSGQLLQEIKVHFPNCQTVPSSSQSAAILIFREVTDSLTHWLTYPFQTCGLSICWALPASAHSFAITTPWETAVLRLNLLTQNLLFETKERSGSPLLPCGTVLNNHWSGTEQLLSVTLKIMKSVFSGAASSHWRTLLIPGCFTASVLWNFFSQVNAILWLRSCSVVYCMQFYRQADDFVPVKCFVECLLVVFCILCCVRAGMSVCAVRVRLLTAIYVLRYFFVSFPDDKTAFHLLYKQFRCIDVPSMHMPMCMW